MKFGKIILINLYDCNPNLIKNKKYIREFFEKICKVIRMKRQGKCKVKRFGKGKLNGISGFQFIETSSISAHFDETKNRAFIDIFSCKKFNSKKAESFCKEYFHSRKSNSKTMIRD